MEGVKKNSLTIVQILYIARIVISAISIFSTENIQFHTILGWVVVLIPDLLFVIYLIIGANKKKLHPLLLISFIGMFLIGLVNMSFYITLYDTYEYYKYTDQAIYAMYMSNVLSAVVTLIYTIGCLIAVISKFKALIVAKIAVGIYAIALLYRMAINNYTLISNIGTILLLAAYAVFWFLFIEAPQQQKQSVQAETLENKLIELKNLYENGTITEEEYNTKRTELLNDF